MKRNRELISVFGIIRETAIGGLGVARELHNFTLKKHKAGPQCKRNGLVWCVRESCRRL